MKKPRAASQPRCGVFNNNRDQTMTLICALGKAEARAEPSDLFELDLGSLNHLNADNIATAWRYLLHPGLDVNDADPAVTDLIASLPDLAFRHEVVRLALIAARAQQLSRRQFAVLAMICSDPVHRG